MHATLAQAHPDSVPLYIVSEADFDAWLSAQTPALRSWLEASNFSAKLGQVQRLPSTDGSLGGAVVGWGNERAHKRMRFVMGKVASDLGQGLFHIEGDLSVTEREEAALGWLLAGYSFDRYKKATAHKARLVAPDGIDAAKIEAWAQGEALTRDLINTPAADMGPTELESAVRDLAKAHQAEVQVIAGDALLARNFPMIHAVGRAAEKAPRLIEMNWGNEGPDLCLVGKGVCFDTGGLNLKPASSMGLMKKDMGGAATVLGLAKMIMQLGLKVKLRVLIPAVENAVAGNAFRPQDVLTSRKGLTVEINNTDAEGRLVLADALALADETPPDLLVCMATLTGAARVAVGPDIAPFYTDDAELAHAIHEGAMISADPVWQMPLHRAYDAMIEPQIADLDNAPSGGFAGSITAALFLDRFVTQTSRFVHFDVYGWCPKPAPARPVGGAGQGARALFEAIVKVLKI